MRLKKILKYFIPLIFLFSCSAFFENDYKELTRAQNRKYKQDIEYVFNTLKRNLLENGYEINYANKEKGGILAIKYYKKFEFFRVNRTFETLKFYFDKKDDKTLVKSILDYGIVDQGYSSEYNPKKYNEIYNTIDYTMKNSKIKDPTHTYTFPLKYKDKIIETLKFLSNEIDDINLKTYNKDSGFVSYYSNPKIHRCFLVKCTNITNYYFTLFEKNGELKLNINISKIYKENMRNSAIDYKKIENEKEYEKIINIIRKSIFTE